MKHLNYQQIRALIKKDILVRLRQPWMTFLSIIWPCAIFLSLYILRLRFKPHQVGECQFPTRQLPANDLLPFFQSYICTIENQCLDVNKYEEVSSWMQAPVTPVLNIVQTLLNEKDLYKAIIELPQTMEFVSLVTKLATHPKFKYIESNADYIVKNLPEIRKAMGNNFDVKQVFSNDGIFSNLGKVLCGKSFPRSNNIRYVDNILYTPDMNKDRPDSDELDVMPTPYCKQLYLDVTNSNNGKITWKILKPIIQGKIIYGPVTDETKLIVSYANKTMDDMFRLRSFFRSIETSINMLNTNEKFRAKFDGLINLAKTPFVKAILGNSVDIDSIENVLMSVITDKQVLEIVKTIGDIFECYNVDRFIPVNSEKELEDVAYELAKKKLFYAAFYFDTESVTNEVTYKLRMEVDNTPVTIENRNRFWFPGPEASFEFEMRYHRGFIELQNAIEIGIIKAKKRRQFDASRSKISSTTPFAPDDLQFSDEDLLFNDFNENNDTSVHHETSTAAADKEDFDDLSFDDFNEPKNNESGTTTTAKVPTFDLGNLLLALGNPNAVTKAPEVADEFDENSDFWNSDDDFDNDTTVSSSKVRRKRQFDGLLGLFGFSSSAAKKQNPNELEFKVDEMRFFTKQFPYPKYTRDDFKKGLYLAQAIQMAFFFALIILVSSSVRQKIWIKESGNLSLMRTMGLCESSETISWIITTFVELAIVFFLCLVILYTGGIMQYTSKLLIYIFLLIFGLCVISFCFMASTFFSTASIGSVSTVILFLTTFLPYIIIISLGTVLSSLGKFIASLSLSTAFCYAWHFIFRTELQEKSLTLLNAFSDGIEDNDFRFGVLMIIFDTFLYATIGLLNKKFSSSSNKFYNVERKNISKELGAEMKKVTKVYDGCDPNKPAVEGVSIDFKKDQILCLLGRNGAGKSTVIKLLTGEIEPTMGEIYLPLDYDLITGFQNEQEQVGLCPQGNVLIPDLTAREHLELYARIKFKNDHRKEVRRVMNNMKLGKYKDYKVSALSGGYKRRLCISIAFLGSPNLVILDEPCSAVDANARKVIWDLIETLRKDRAVVMSTHDLDEAQHLGDQIIMMKDGRIVMEATTKDLHHELTKNFAINVELKASISTDKETIDEVREVITSHYKKEPNVIVKDCTLTAIMPCFDDESKKMDYGDLFRALEKLQTDKKIVNFSITSKTLESYYKSIENDTVPMINGHSNGHNNNNNNNSNNMETIDLRKTHNGHQNGSLKGMHDNTAPFRDIVSNLFLKRFLHFKRNYRLLICIMVLPVIFEVIAMGFMIIRPPGDYDNQVEFNRSMYPNSVEFYSKQKADPFSGLVYEDLEDTCLLNGNCDLFDSSKDSYEWLIRTHEEYIRRRYGGVSINQSRSIVWYNNKGYHSMPLYLNILSSAIIKKELNDSSYNIRAINHPLQLGEDELSVSSILQQVADAGISLILLVSFSLVIAGASVFIVNERVSGEKLQQQLCGVRYRIYWGVAFVWDFVIYCFAIFCAVIVFYIFNIPIYVEGDNLGGIVLLLFAFGFAMIPYVHLFEKLFNEASFANMSIFCLNVIMGLSTVSIVIMFDVLAETNEHERIRNFLNRLFLIFPQHALADGLIEICKNHIMSKIFIRYYINTYKSPITSDLLRPHLTALIALGIIFIVLNYIVESGIMWTLFKNQPKQSSTELKVITIQNTLTKEKRNDTGNDDILKVENLYKSYNGNEFAVNNVSFNVKKGECYGCLGTNGAGKSTVFSILSGETKRFAGTVQLASDVDKYSISYCPQTNALDPLLTVEEIMRFYGTLRNIKDLDGLVESGLENFHLKPYRNVLVKNLSGGNRRKLSVACSSFGNLSLVLMDEPVSDMDPITRYLVYKTIKELNDENCSVILTSHSIAELEHVCHSIGILVDGNMVASGTPERLKKEFGNRYVVTILSEKPLDYHFETDLRKTFRSMKNTVCHQYSAQFLMQVRDFENVDHCHIKLSELIDLLNAFTTVKDLKYTITACMIDQVYESIIKRGVLGVDNNGYVQNEYHVT